MESHRKSILKAVSYRVFGTASTFLISYMFTDSVVIGASIAATETIVKIVLYYVHERLWSKVK